MIDLRKEPNNLPTNCNDIWMFDPKQNKWVVGYATRQCFPKDGEPFDRFYCYPYQDKVNATHWAHIHDYPPPTPEQ